MSMTKNVSIVFYKGPGTLSEKLIRLWTRSPYAHCEFRRSDGLYHSNDRFRLVSRTERIDIRPDEWEECSIELPSEIVERVERRQLRKNGSAYDWTGIVFSHVFRLGIHNKRRWFCSKSNADDLVYAYRLMKRCRHPYYFRYLKVLEPITSLSPNTLTPSSLFTLVQQMEHIQERFA